MQRRAQTAKAHHQMPPEAAALCKEFERLETDWYTKRLPNLGASNTVGDRGIWTRVGRELARVDDDTGAAMWNNKFSVWLNEFSVAPTQ